MLFKKIALASALVLLISGCEQFDQFKEQLMGKSDSTETTPETPVEAIATVNGQPISVEMFNSYARARMQQQKGIDIDQHRGAIINELINRQLLAQEAVKSGLDKKSQVKAEIQSQQENILSSMMMRHHLSQNETTEEMIKQEYDDFVKNTNFDEYKVSHIMIKTKEEADAIMAKLDKGESFSEIAKKKSLDPNGKQGGSLGWVTPARMPAPFAQMLSTIKKGKQGSMSGPNGWHIFRMDDIRTKEPPSFEDSKQAMAGKIQKKNLQEFIEKLKTAANIEIKKTEETPVEPAASTPTVDAPATTN